MTKLLAVLLVVIAKNILVLSNAKIYDLYIYFYICFFKCFVHRKMSNLKYYSCVKEEIYVVDSKINIKY